MTNKIPNEILVMLNEISERLWSGHASVMVGAGFSKNATKNSNSSKPFLTWNQLADVFHQKLNGEPPKSSDHYLNPLKLAEEVCAAFGRPALEKLIETSLPDQDYSPSELHRDLLELPWNDVFTTNYDTILERTKVSQRYDVVLSNGDLVYSQRPRIIKLHGSFPSHRPFIITEEDYRKYPRESAPFVNTVQQSLIENTLCLIGFSGDDPNFLSWIGWIRDNLGSSSSPRIFLIGLLNFTASQIKVLEQRNIGIIDLSPCVVNDNDKHKKALEVFLDYLKSKKSEESRLDWPKNNPAPHAPPHDGSDDNFIEAMKSVSTLWLEIRKEYPGWVVCPRDRRGVLWQYTDNWMFGKHLKIQTPFSIDILFFRELAWRLEKCLSPLYEHIVEAIEQVTSRYNPFPQKINLPAEFDRKNTSICTEQSWSEVADAWLYLNFSLLRFYREEGLTEKWSGSSKKLELCGDELSAAQRNTLYYEQCLFYLFNQNIVDFRTALQSWKPDTSLPFFQAKKAGLLAEYGNVDEAADLLEIALQSVRTKLNLTPITTDYTDVSQEAYILQLLKFLKDAKTAFSSDKKDRKYIEEYGLRWTKLKQYKCDPWGELQIFDAKLNTSPKEYQSHEIVHSFDIGRSSKTRHFSSDEEAIEAFSFLRYMDEIGIPYQIQNMNFGREASRGAIARIGKYSPNWAMATLLRSGDDKSVDTLFGRISLAKVAPTKIESLTDILLKLLTDLSDDIARGDGWKKENIGVHYASIVPEILSRLCTRCSFEKLEKIYDFLLTVYKSNHRMKYSNIDHLALRLVNSWPTNRLPNLISKIFSELPLISGLHEVYRSKFPDLLELLEWDRIESVKTKIKAPKNAIEQLLSDFDVSTGTEKTIAFRRLAKAFQMGLLAEEQKKMFGNTVWKNLDSVGFPADFLGVFKWFFLDLPHPENISPKQSLLNYLRNISFPIQTSSRPVTMTNGYFFICSEFIGASKMLAEIGWTSDDSENLFIKLSSWWDNDKKYLQESLTKKDVDLAEEYRARSKNIVKLLSVAVIPILSEAALSKNESGIMRIIQEMTTLGVYTAEATTQLFLRNHLESDKVCSSILMDVISNDPSRVRKAIIEIAFLLKPGTHTLPPPDQENLISIVIDAIKWRRSEAVVPALANLNEIVGYPIKLSDHQMKDILLSLEYLIKDSNISYEAGQIALEHRLYAREMTARLSFTLYQNIKSSGIPIPPVLEQWREICHDPREFAEIRNQWLD